MSQQDEKVLRVAQQLEAEMNQPTDSLVLARVALLVRDRVQHRLLEGIATQLGLHIEEISEEQLGTEDVSRFEAVITDPADAERLQDRFAKATPADGVNPLVIVLGKGEGNDEVFPSLRTSSGIIELPQEPAQLSAQLSILLYAHRAFTARYQSAMDELHLNRRIFRSVTSGISVASASEPDLPLIYVNPAFEVMTGYQLEEIQGKNCRFLQGDDREQGALTALREALANRKQVTVVLRNYRKDGTCFWNELSIAPIRSREGEVTHIVGLQNDVTARVEFEAALRESEKLAAVGRLAASIAHEINNPLESVMNLLYLAENEDSTEEIKKYVRDADAEVKRIALITTQSLRFYRQNTRPQAIDCDVLLTEVLDLYMPKILRFHIAIKHDRATHAMVVCLDSEIRQVLSNLVRNAIDAMRPKGGRLTVRTRVMTEHRNGSRGVAITVADTGTGISPEVMRKLYTAFFTTKGDVGTGLGLWVSASIVERHRGRVMVRSRQGKGTVFTVFLPFDGITEKAD